MYFIWFYYIRRTTRPGCAGTTTNLQIVLNTPKKSLLKSGYRYPKKYLPYFPSQKNPRIKNFKPKMSFDHPRHLKSELPDHPRRLPLPWEQTGRLHFSPGLVY